MKKSEKQGEYEFPKYKFKENQNFRAKDFKPSNIEIRKEIAKKIISETPFSNSEWEGDDAYKAVSLLSPIRKNKQNRDNIVIFTSNAKNDKKINFYHIRQIK